MHPECTSITCMQDIFWSSFVGHKVVEGCGRLPFDPMLPGGCCLATMLFLKNQISRISVQRKSQESTNAQKSKWSKIMTERSFLPPCFQGSWEGHYPSAICRSVWLQLRSCPGALKANGNVGVGFLEITPGTSRIANREGPSFMFRVSICFRWILGDGTGRPSRKGFAYIDQSLKMLRVHQNPSSYFNDIRYTSPMPTATLMKTLTNYCRGLQHSVCICLPILEIKLKASTSLETNIYST